VDEDTGEINVDKLKDEWTCVLSISKVLLSLQSLLTDPWPGPAMNIHVRRILVAQAESRFSHLLRTGMEQVLA